MHVDTQVATASIPDATTLIKGKIQLAGDLGGTAASPEVALLAITNAKLGDLRLNKGRIGVSWRKVVYSLLAQKKE